MRFLLCVALSCFFVWPLAAQDNRRDREEPELVIESGGRTGTCDAARI